MPTRDLNDQRDPTVKPKYMVYLPLTGGMPILGLELSRVDEKIHLKNPAHLSVNSRQTGYEFAPVQFIERDFRLYESGLAGDGAMPKMIQQAYEAWADKEGT